MQIYKKNVQLNSGPLKLSLRCSDVTQYVIILFPIGTLGDLCQPLNTSIRHIYIYIYIIYFYMYLFKYITVRLAKAPYHRASLPYNL